MKNLDNINEINKIDISHVYDSVLALPKQCEQAWDDASRVDIPHEYSDIENLAMCGMGGSGLAARVIENLYFDKLMVPLIRVNDYNLPSFVNEKSLVICSSYSGSTEETIENIKQAQAKKSKWIAVSTGGKVIEMAKEFHAPYYQIVARHNPCNQPRMAVGYSIVGQLALLNNLNIIKISDKDISTTISIMNQIIESYKVEISTTQNLAKLLAEKLKDKIPILVSSEHLIGAAHILNNQLNENSKVFTADFAVPELNHHLMEGLKHPSLNKSNLHLLFINSNLCSDKIKKRFAVTKDVVSQNGIEFSNINLKSKEKLQEVFELIQYGAFINYYLAVLYKQNPAPIPWVDYFKEKLSK